MKDHTKIIITCVVVIGILETTALIMGIDGAYLVPICVILSGLAGLKVKQIPTLPDIIQRTKQKIEDARQH